MVKIKKIIPLIIAIQISSYFALYAEEIPKDKPGTAVFVMKSQQGEKINVTSEIIKESPQGLEIDMKIPIINGLNNKFFQKGLNHKIQKQQLCLKKTIEQDAVRNHQYAKKKGFPIIPYTLMTNYHVKSNNKIFSLETTVYDYRGGAYDLTTNTYYNINTGKSKLIAIKDLFKPSSPYKEILNEEINKQIGERRSQGAMFFDNEEGFKGIKDNQSFYITEDGHLVIVFALYEIAPYASGIIEFTIPNEVIDEIKAYD